MLTTGGEFAIEGATENLQYEVAPHGIRLTLVEPGGAKTSGISNMIKTPHPGYHQALMAGFEKASSPMETRLPGPKKLQK